MDFSRARRHTHGMRLLAAGFFIPTRRRKMTGPLNFQILDHVAVTVGAQGSCMNWTARCFELSSLRPMIIFPPDTRDLPCPDRKEAQFYRVIRQGKHHLRLDPRELRILRSPVSGTGWARMMYAISTDGRILRRLVGDQTSKAPSSRKPRMLDADGSAPNPASPLIRNVQPTAGRGNCSLRDSHSARHRPRGGVPSRWGPTEETRDEEGLAAHCQSRLYQGSCSFLPPAFFAFPGASSPIFFVMVPRSQPVSSASVSASV